MNNLESTTPIVPDKRKISDLQDPTPDYHDQESARNAVIADKKRARKAHIDIITQRELTRKEAIDTIIEAYWSPSAKLFWHRQMTPSFGLKMHDYMLYNTNFVYRVIYFESESYLNKEEIKHDNETLIKLFASCMFDGKRAEPKKGESSQPEFLWKQVQGVYHPKLFVRSQFEKSKGDAFYLWTQVKMAKEAGEDQSKRQD